jgi:uncharacterized repeat protein (TIGR03803 family)
MQIFASRRALRGGFFVLGAIVLTAGPSLAASPLQPKPIYNFKASNDGNQPVGAVVIGPDGAFYGVTKFGGKGSCQCGVVFKLTAPGAGQTAWGYKIIYSFAGLADGSQPNGNLVFDADGDLYGTTSFGGDSDPGALGNGIVFRLHPTDAGKTKWREQVIYRFQGGTDGAQSGSGLVVGKDGALYGVTPSGGDGLCTQVNNCGTAYRLKATSADKKHWAKARIHDFDITTDGMHPSGRLMLGKNGVLYGTTADGGGQSDGGTVAGTVFKLTPPAKTQPAWKFAVLARFIATDGIAADGVFPVGGVNFGPDGALYGTTSNQGNPKEASVCGTAFRLALDSLELTTIARFNGGADGCAPQSAPVVDQANNVYGASQGGSTNGAQNGGALYQLHGPALKNGLWSKSIATLRNPERAQGASELIGDASGKFYGVTRFGGTHGMGMVFMISP